MFEIKLTVPVDNTRQLKKALEALAKKELLVGYPEGGTPRKQKGLGNPDLAYLNEHGSPAQNIPPRPFLEPGLESVKDELAQHLTSAALAALDGNPEGMNRGFEATGLKAVSGIRNYITTGVPPALSPVTLILRRRRGIRGTKPLIASGQMLGALTYVVKDKTR